MRHLSKKGRYGTVRFDSPSPHGSTEPINTAQVAAFHAASGDPHRSDAGEGLHSRSINPGAGLGQIGANTNFARSVLGFIDAD